MAEQNVLFFSKKTCKSPTSTTEKMLRMINHQENENQNHNEISPNT